MNFEITNNASTQGTNRTSKPEDSEKIKREAKAKGEFIVSLSTDDKTLTSIAKKFNMSLTDFKNMTGLTKDTLQKGQKIKNVPTAKIDSGMGIASVAKKHGMTLEQFCALNGIKKDYKPQKGEYFYVFPNNTSKKKPSNTSAANTPAAKPAKETTAPEKPLKAEEIADKLEEAADDYRGVVGKEAFDKVFNQINKDNVIDVVEKFKEKNGKSLINMISDEWSSDKEVRKAAMTKIFDLVADKTKNSSKELRDTFIDELNDEFDSWGFVSTKKMDKIINGMIHPEEAEKPSGNKKTRTDNTGSNASHLSGKVYPNEIFYSTNGGKSKDITPTTMTTIKDGDGNYVNAGTLKSWALSGGKRDKGFKDVKDPFIMRPLPNYNTETKKIEAVTEVLEPTSDGNLTGKVVVLNPGHGGYQQNNGFFDAGTVLSVKNAEGEEMPIEEWRVAQSYVEKIADNLRDRGAQVVIVSGAVQNGGMYAQKYLENMLAGKKGDDNVRDLMDSTDKSDMLFLSVHVESVKENPDAKKCTVRYTKDIDKELAENINKHVNQGFMALTPTLANDNLYVNRAAKGITSSLLEIGNIANEKITNSLLSDYDQKKYANCIANAIEETMLN
ncbi:TPA: N-acetylmuramoyl-L-alanine amidase [Candidatus Scatousia excrementigallinarum]|uniref:N-acetylmuramoyl-L-alanine amidase n=1 Tax=Candidatus Scatousia excrementigallinarum TaxID=2840935 RepID=A0A9D1JNC4_9BACT|nr:N-acetylmuramoyl-L-alanine amidase [Candidatus Scatousia excrementigallinarum]